MAGFELGSGRPWAAPLTTRTWILGSSACEVPCGRRIFKVYILFSVQALAALPHARRAAGQCHQVATQCQCSLRCRMFGRCCSDCFVKCHTQMFASCSWREQDRRGNSCPALPEAGGFELCRRQLMTARALLPLSSPFLASPSRLLAHKSAHQSVKLCLPVPLYI